MKKNRIVIFILFMGCILIGIGRANISDGLVAYYPFNGNYRALQAWTEPIIISISGFSIDERIAVIVSLS